MKYVKIGTGLLVLALLCFALFVIVFGSNATLEGSVKIKAPASLVFEEINNFRTYKAWTVMNQLDSTTKYTYEGSIRGLGAKRTWFNADPKVWNGSMEIVKSTPSSNVVIELMVDSNRDGDNFNDLKTPAIINYDLTETDGVTEVKRTISFTELEGLNKLRGTFISYMIGKSFKEGLVSLKNRIENKPLFTKDMSIISMPQLRFVYKEVTCSRSTLIQSSRDALEEVQAFMADSHVAASGYPITQFTQYSEDQIQMRCGFPIESNLEPTADFQIDETYSGDVLRIVHYGSLEELPEAHSEASEYFDYYLHMLTGDPYEVYVIGADTEANPANWRTDLYYPIE